MSNMSLPKIRIKLVIDNTTNKVLGAEARKDFVDIVSGFLTYPFGTIIKLLEPIAKTGTSLDTLYESLRVLNDQMFVSSKAKELLLNYKPHVDYNSPLFPSVTVVPTVFCTCGTGYCSSSFMSQVSKVCPCCNRMMLKTVTMHVPQDNGFLRGDRLYSVLDDLTIEEHSTLSLIHKFNMKDGLIRVQDVEVGREEALHLLLNSISSKNVLTDTFVKGDGVGCRFGIKVEK